jgi:CRISPR system Cascade subunit CasA
MSISFNLIDQRWIPCLRDDGTRDDLSLHDALTQAHQLREIRGDTPLETAALHRLLLAVLHRVFGPKDRAAWFALWKRKDVGFEVAPLENYLKTWRHKFDLFDERHPFLQIADEEQLGDEDTVNKMVLHLTADATLFQHTLNSPVGGAELTSPQAARALLTVQAFALGYQLFVDGPCAKGAVFFIWGDSLYETLVLNLSRYPEEDGDYQSTSDDAPAWEIDSPFKVKFEGKTISRDASVVKGTSGKQRPKFDGHTPLGQLDYLTWHNRKIKLLPEITPNGIVVRQMAWAPGMRLADEITDPMQTHLAVEGRGWVALAFNTDKALWRDSGTLLRIADDPKKYRPIKAVKWLSLISRFEPTIFPKTLRLSSFGMVKNRASLDFMRAETLPLPLEFLMNKDCVSDLSTALELAEKTGKLLNRCAFLLAWLIFTPSTPDVKFDESNKNFDEQELIDGKFARGKNDKSKDREAQQAYQLFSSFGVERVYWSQLEAHFQRLIQDLPSQPEAAAEKWRGHLRRVARAAFSQAVAYAGTDRRAQRAIVKAEEQFRFGLARLLNVKESDFMNGGEMNVAN